LLERLFPAPRASGQYALNIEAVIASSSLQVLGSEGEKYVLYIQDDEAKGASEGWDNMEDKHQAQEKKSLKKNKNSEKKKKKFWSRKFE
jgi:hypothetical protein